MKYVYCIVTVSQYGIMYYRYVDNINKQIKSNTYHIHMHRCGILFIC